MKAKVKVDAEVKAKVKVKVQLKVKVKVFDGTVPDVDDVAVHVYARVCMCADVDDVTVHVYTYITQGHSLLGPNVKCLLICTVTRRRAQLTVVPKEISCS